MLVCRAERCPSTGGDERRSGCGRNEQRAVGVPRESLMAVDTADVRANTVDDDDARRPLMTAGNIAWMNLGFFGVQFSFGLTQTAVNPLFLLLGAKPEYLPIL